MTIARAKGSITFPARFLLFAASNPCPCGFLNHLTKRCRCSVGEILRYKRKVSGPLLDRIDIHLDVPPVDVTKLSNNDIVSEKSETIRKRVIQARMKQQKRFADTPIRTNGEMNASHIKKMVHISADGETILKQAVSRLSLSARSYFKVIKIAQTIADLGREDEITVPSIAEALQYRTKEDV